MRKIEVDVDGVAVRVGLMEDQAPVTCRRLWDLLPYEDLFTHSIWSGLMIHSNSHPKLDLDVSRYPLIENPVGFIAPGDLIVWPQGGLVGLAYGATEFRWLTGAWVVTKIGEIEGDWEELARKAGRMMWEGAAKVRMSRSQDTSQTGPSDTEATGKLVEIEFDSMKWVAELFEEETPDYCKALWDSLPLEGPTTITHSSGEVLHFWVNIPVPASAPREYQAIVPVEYVGKKVGVTSVAYDPKSMRGQHPGDIVWGSTWNGVRIVYGQGRFGGPGGGVSVANRPKLGRIIRGDLAEFAKRASRIPWEGSKPMAIRRFVE